jgi:ribosome biogenesis GTPase A
MGAREGPGGPWHLTSSGAVPAQDEPDLLLCDCPGLVFPTVAGSKAQMICDGLATG